MKYVLFIFLLSIYMLPACSQSSSKTSNISTQKKVGGSCEGCEAIYANPIPFDKLSWIDTLPDFKEKGPKLLVSGVIYNPDGHTPAKNVVMYVYHTDQTGRYTNRNNEKGWSGRNGYIKGWIKTNDKGQYKFYTLRPASYPGSVIPAHIHAILLEPGKTEYFIDEFLFDNDPFLTTEQRNRQEGRGGNGIMKITMYNGMQTGTRTIYLGKNIPQYN
jgi:protocatechuate 3,4-dioxygenase beta subunit